MKKTRKILLMAACAILLVCISVGATVAYLTSTDSVTNTFTVGNIQIKLDEAKTNADGTAVSPATRTEEGNEYKLLPGHPYIKDPTVTVVKGSEESYVRMLVKVENIDKLKAAFPQASYSDYYTADGLFLLEKLCGGWDSTIWMYNSYKAENTTDGKQNGIYEFRYKTTVTTTATADTKLPALFATITVPGTVANDELANLAKVKIVVTAEAIQKDGFADANAAWAAFNG